MTALARLSAAERQALIERLEALAELADIARSPARPSERDTDHQDDDMPDDT